MKIKKITMHEFFRDIMKGDLEEREVFRWDFNDTESDEVVYHYHNKHDGKLVGIYHDIADADEADYYMVIP
jgi:hypothetical protein